MNFDGVTCTNNACLNKLAWLSDGNTYAAIYSNDEVKMSSNNDEQPCVVFNNDHKTHDKNCRDMNYFACQFSCDSGTYGN